VKTEKVMSVVNLEQNMSGAGVVLLVTWKEKEGVLKVTRELNMCRIRVITERCVRSHVRSESERPRDQQ
jgi:hypothetical protein